MVFSSYIFTLAFLPVVLFGYYMLSHMRNSIYQRVFILTASLFFYGYYNVKYVFLLVASIAVNYTVARQIQKTSGNTAKWLLILGIVFNVGLIGYYKYCDFFIENVNLVFGTSIALKRVLLPLGISFFTFQQLSFLVSVYRAEEKVERLRDYCLFVVFFPQLVAGPIVLYSEMIPQFKDESRRYFRADNFAAGIYLFSFGLFKKAAIADTLAVFADAGFGMTGMGLSAGWMTSICYTLQIYFDFSGYSDMAIGLGKMFNIEIPANFRKPYLSESVTEFWRRWHITLGRALSTYVYKPLGGNRRGLTRTCINLFLTFLVSGIWHGAAWTFVLWGAIYGMLVVLERLFESRFACIPKWARVTVTFLFVNALWVLFRADSFSQAVEVYRGMVNIHQLGGVRALVSATNSTIGSLINAGTLIVSFAALSLLRLPEKIEEIKLSSKTAGWSAAFFVVAFLCLSRESVFIYFNF